MENGREEEKVEGKRTFDRWRGRAGHRCDACFFSRSFPFPSLPAPSRPDSDHSAPHGHADERSSRARAVARAKKAEKDRKKQGQKNERRKKLTCTSLVVPGSTIPLDGRTANFFGAVVLSLKATGWGWGWRFEGEQGQRSRFFRGGPPFSLSLPFSLPLVLLCSRGERETRGSQSVPGSSWRSSPAAMMMLCFFFSRVLLLAKKKGGRGGKAERKKK